MALFRPRYRDPDATRMTFGDHLEELRRRVIYALLGFAVAVVICWSAGGFIIETLNAPYTVAMEQLGYDPRMVQLNPIESFVEYVKITMEFALVLSAPWMLFQIWLFVAAGLYPSEQRIVRLFAPTSIGLFVLGASFMIAIVLSGLLKFLISVSMWLPLPDDENFLYRWLNKSTPAQVQTTQPVTLPLAAPVFDGDLAQVTDGDVWINRSKRRISVRYDGETYYAPLQPAGQQKYVQPFFSIAEYLGFVVNLSLAFGLGFQIPIVVVFLIVLGIVPASAIASARRYVLLGVVIFAAILTPTPDAATMLLLSVPMYLLFEIGLVVGRMLEKQRREVEET